MTAGTLELAARFRETRVVGSTVPQRVMRTPAGNYPIQQYELEDEATIEILADDAFLRRVRTGLAELERGESLTFEQASGIRSS